jgi:hypothetical protein
MTNSITGYASDFSFVYDNPATGEFFIHHKSMVQAHLQTRALNQSKD